MTEVDKVESDSFFTTNIKNTYQNSISIISDIYIQSTYNNRNKENDISIKLPAMPIDSPPCTETAI